MAYFKWGVIAAVALAVFAFFHYVLLSYDTVRIVGTEVRMEDRVQAGADGTQQTVKDDVRYINAVDSDGAPHVYRNEDNWWYIKYDSGDLQAEADSLVSPADNPTWVTVRHYGWRVPLFSWFPNALAVNPASGPDDVPFPWFNVIVLTVLVIGVLVLRRILIIMRKRHVDPVVDAIDEELDETAGWWRRQWRRISGR